MNFIDYLEEKIYFILVNFSILIFLDIYAIILNMGFFFIFIIDLVYILIILSYLIISYKKEKLEMQKIINLVDSIEDKFLISEILEKPKEMKNYAYYYALKKGCKSMNDKIGNIEKIKNDYKEYLESFVHEIKTPISAISLLCDNKNDYKIKSEIYKIDNLVEQILYYSRSENPEKDYFIKEINLEDVVHDCIMNFKEIFLKKEIIIKTKNLNMRVFSDEKWVKFIIGQIIQNSIKYMNKSKKQIEIYTEISDGNGICLCISDNGIGINSSDLPRIFDYGFTGSNRKKSHSTGMGLYICKKLCNKLGLLIEAKSIENKYTKIIIKFSN